MILSDIQHSRDDVRVLLLDYSKADLVDHIL